MRDPLPLLSMSVKINRAIDACLPYLSPNKILHATRLSYAQTECTMGIRGTLFLEIISPSLSHTHISFVYLNKHTDR
jgi:hypothetical protein